MYDYKVILMVAKKDIRLAKKRERTK